MPLRAPLDRRRLICRLARPALRWRPIRTSFPPLVPKGDLIIFEVPDDDRVPCMIDDVSLLEQAFLRALSLEDLGRQLIVELIQLPVAQRQLDVLLFQFGDKTLAVMFKHITFVEFYLRNNTLGGRGIMKGVENL